MRRIRVLIVEDSQVVREFLRRVVSSDARLEIAAAVGSAEEALRVLDAVFPDVISMDIRLPGMDGFEATRRIMSERPTPIVVVSGLDADETTLSMEALKAGAVGVVEKPPAATHENYAALAGHLCTQLAILSEVKVVRQRPPAGRAAGAARRPLTQHGPYRVLGLAASTGGPNALMTVLGGLGPDFPLPMLVVQHIGPAFVDGFSAWLARVTSLPVETVTGRTPLCAGRVYVAPAERHLVADRLYAWTECTPPVANHRPSGSVLFASLAKNLCNAAIGVLLTGMGEDGAHGMLEVRKAGGYTIAEHESTAVVYGMPAAGVRLGAACESLPLPEIAPRLLELVAAAEEAA